MHVLVCIKRVPAPGARIVLTEDQTAIDTRHLGFTVSPHEECAVEEAVQINERLGGSTTVLTLGPPEAQEQLRTAMSMGIQRGVLLQTDNPGWDPRATATAITEAVRQIESQHQPFDLILFGTESADAGNYQVGIRVAQALNRPIVSGVKQLSIEDGEIVMHRAVESGFELCRVATPAVAAVMEGLNLPRYPSMRGRLAAKNATIDIIEPQPRSGGLITRRLHHPPQQQSETVVLGTGSEAATAVVDLFERVGLL
ncbi:MAG: electron transfer flavoprotein subunit beta/FixA family protein [Nitriliruptoraceae bacterium]